MLVPPQNTLVFRGFAYAVMDGKDGENKPVKILTFQDPPHVGLNMCFVFSVEEFETFKQKTSESRIVPATEMPSESIIKAG